MSQYKNFTVDVTQGDADVVGNGTEFLTKAIVGGVFVVVGIPAPYVVGYIADDTHLTLTEAYAGVTAAGVNAAITTSFTPNKGLPYPEQGDIETATINKRAMLLLDTLAGNDPLVKLSDTSAGNTLDAGVYSLYQPSSTPLFAGLFLDATDHKWKLFTGLQVEPGDTVNTAGAGYTVPTLVANLEGSVAGLSIGVDVQAYDADLAAIAGLTTAADKLPYFTGLHTAAVATFTAAGRALVDDADAAAQRTTLGLGTVATLASDTDTALAANSDANVATQKAVKAYVDGLLAASDAVIYKGATDCSANPNYPAANAGHLYVVSVAGKIGGASGTVVEAGDMFICKTDGTAGGTQAAVGAQWNVIQTNINGAVVGPASAVDGRVVLFDGTTGKLIKDSGLTLSGSNTGDQTISLTGDITGSGAGSFAATIANGSVTYAKMQNVSATSRFLGRITGGAGSPEELTAANAKTILSYTISDIGGLGTGVATALAVNVGSAGAPVVLNGAGGTPSALTLTNASGLPVSALLSGLLAENVGIGLDTSLSADGKYCGITQDGTATATTAFGELVYLVTATSKWAKAKADAAATSANQLGMCVVAAANANDPITVMLFGKVRADSLFDTFTVGAPVYISAATAGKTVSAAPTGTTDFVVRKVGFAEDANTVFFNPGNDYITLA
jgi:hypothetical protein